MPETNAFTADAATQTARPQDRPLMLIGIFTGTAQDHILMRNRDGDILRVSAQTSQGGFILTSTGNGWAMVEHDGTFYRLSMG